VISPMLRTMDRGSPVGEMLRAWRKRRRYTQLELAGEAEVSPRHLSYLENGRAKPSRQMVLVLASALEVPLADRNRLLLAAGYAPAYREAGLEGPEAEPIDRAFRYLLARHEPYPAAVVDPGWNVQMANDAYAKLIAFLVGTPGLLPSRPIHDAPPVRGSNGLTPLFDPSGLRPCVANFGEVAPVLLAHLRHAAASDAAARATLDRVEQFELPEDDPPAPALPVVVPLVLTRDGTRLSLFSSMTMLGTAMDAVLSSLRLETFFPRDGATDAALRRITA